MSLCQSWSSLICVKLCYLVNIFNSFGSNIFLIATCLKKFQNIIYLVNNPSFEKINKTAVSDEEKGKIAPPYIGGVYEHITEYGRYEVDKYKKHYLN